MFSCRVFAFSGRHRDIALVALPYCLCSYITGGLDLGQQHWGSSKRSRELAWDTGRRRCMRMRLMKVVCADA